MRILIGNDIDDSLFQKESIVSAQHNRIFWFAADGDILVVPRPPDERFLRHVTRLTGVDRGSLRIHLTPPGRFGDRLIDPMALTDPELLRAVSDDVEGHDSVFALWPGVAVARFAFALGVSLPGGEFFAQDGAEIVNNNANFRGFAAAARVALSPGFVCRDIDDAAAATAELFDTTDAVMVKKAHSGAGLGNRIVTRNPELDVARAGGRHVNVVSSVREFWSQHWDWASAHGRHAVVVEQFVPRAESVYAEFHCGATKVELRQVGNLIFEDRSLVREVVPYRDLAPAVRHQLVSAGTRLATYYRDLGYRGPLSADALVTERDEVLFTEVNCQATGSTHLYGVIGAAVVRTADEPKRTLTQCGSSEHWTLLDTDHFLRTLNEIGCAYDPVERVGVLVVMPVTRRGDVTGVQYCVVHATPEGYTDIAERLDKAFGA